MSTAPEKSKAKPAAKADAAEAKAKKPAAAKPAKEAKAKAAEGTGDAKPAKAAKKTVAKKAKPAAPTGPARSAHAESRLAQVLVAPIVSEKATMAAEKHNQVLFKVLRDATKPEIKAAVELMFKVTVDSVQTVQHKGKTKRFGKSSGRRDHVKKAYVCLAAGQELNFSGEAA
jgi:large subunit ribosomal protein L23